MAVSVVLGVLATGAVGGRVMIAPTDPDLQYIGRMADAADGSKMFDMPGCEIRATMSLPQGHSPFSPT